MERSAGVRAIEHWPANQNNWWEVFFPDGTVGRYGDQFGAWELEGPMLLTSLRDKFGNEIAFTYSWPITGGGYLTKVTYGGGEIVFSYQLRQDSSNYLRKIALNQIAVRTNGAVIRSYRLENVKSGPGETDPLRLERIQMCAYEESGSGEQCLAPIGVTWTQLPGAPQGYGDAVATVSDGTNVRAQFDYALLPAATAHSHGYSEEPFGPLIPDATARSHPFGIATPVVTQMRSADGIGGWRRTSFAYKGIPLYDAGYRGLIGFAERRITGHQVPEYSTSGNLITRDVTTYVQYRLSFPYSGQVAQRLTVLDGDWVSALKRIRHQEILYAHYNLFGGLVVAPFVAREMTRDYEDGAVVSASITTHLFCYLPLSGDECPTSGTAVAPPTQRTTTRYVANDLTSPAFTPSYWGQVPTRAASTTLSSLTTIENLSNDTASWIIGFPAKITTTSTGVGASSVTRVETRVRYSTTPATQTIVSLPGSTHELTTTFDYDGVGNVSSVSLDGPNFETQTNSFSSFIDNRYPQYVTNAESQQTQFDYDLRFGSPRAATNPNLLTDLIERDPFGRVTSISDAEGTVTRQYYEPCLSSTCTQYRAVLLLTRIAMNGSTQVTPTEWIYLDALGREVLSEVEGFSSSDGRIRIETRYDSRGRMTHRSLPYFSNYGTPVFTQFYHDVRERLVRETRPDGGIVAIDYAGSSGSTVVTRTETVVDSAGSSTRVKRSVFDARGLMTSTTDAYGQTGAVTTSYTYDALGNIATVTVGGVQVSSAQFNVAGHRTSFTEANTGLTTFVTDSLGRVRSQTDARGITTQ